VTEETWIAVDRFFCDHLVPSDEVLDAVLEESAAAGLPDIQLAPNQAALLQMLARLQGASRLLEIGTLGGYSGIWLARALPEGGRLVTVEANPHHAEVARRNFERADVLHKVDLRLGPAADVLPAIAREGGDPFDLVFIDADKRSIPLYFDWALRLTRPGSLIIVDNVVRRGEVAVASSANEDVQGVRRFIQSLKGDDRVQATALQTVGTKGYDGFAIVQVL
jgi:predicted O-methyltransferase YrrM